MSVPAARIAARIVFARELIYSKHEFDICEAIACVLHALSKSDVFGPDCERNEFVCSL